MNKKILLSALVAAAFSAGIAHASAPGFYGTVSGGIGGMDTKNTSRSDASAAAADDDFSLTNYSDSLRSGMAYRLAVGYLFGQGNFNYGLEFGYTSYPNNTYKTSVTDNVINDDSNVTYKGDSIDLLGVAKYNFNGDQPGFYALGKAGLASVTQKTQVSESGYDIFGDEGSGSGSETKTEYKPEVAIGAGYDFTQNVGVDLTYDHIFAGQANPFADTDSSLTKISSVNTLMLGLTYHFA